MSGLVATSILWAFSFSFIGVYLAGKVDPYLAVTIRFALAAIVLTPFLKLKGVSKKTVFQIMGIGSIQIGLMYLAFYNSFLLLKVPEVILFTIFTPIYISLIFDLLEKRFSTLYLLSAIVAVAGAAVLKWSALSTDFIFGFLLVQVANICFAVGQVLYVRVTKNNNEITHDKDIFALFYYGALIVSIPATLVLGNLEKIPTTIEQYSVLIWLGVVASGVGYLLWNSGAKRVSSGVLAVMNNLVIPLGIIANIAIWGKDMDHTKLIIGTMIISFALYIAVKAKKEISA